MVTDDLLTILLKSGTPDNLLGFQSKSPEFGICAQRSDGPELEHQWSPGAEMVLREIVMVGYEGLAMTVLHD